MDAKLEKLALFHDLGLLAEELAGAEHAHLAQDHGLSAGDLERLLERRNRLAEQLEPGLAAHYRWLCSMRPRPIVAERDGVCQGCFTRRPTKMAQAPRASGPERCERCGRILIRDREA